MLCFYSEADARFRYSLTLFNLPVKRSTLGSKVVTYSCVLRDSLDCYTRADCAHFGLYLDY